MIRRKVFESFCNILRNFPEKYVANGIKLLERSGKNLVFLLYITVQNINIF